MTPPQIAAEYGISVDKVLCWIRAGELRAVNIATNPNGRPRWVIDQADLAAFEVRRAATPAASAARRKRQGVAGVTEYF
jgi:hypothetical protein